MPEGEIMASSRDYWEPSFQTLYDAWYQELVSEALLVRWERIDIVATFLAAITASGSAIAGWTLWTQPGWKFLWVVLAGIASVLIIAHGAMRVPSRVKEQGELHKLFSELRVDLETFRQELVTSLKVNEAQVRYLDLRNRLSQCIKLTHPDIAYTTRFGNNIQEKLNGILEDKRYI